MGKADRDVYIVNVGGEDRVRPGVAAVKGGRKKKILFRNATDTDVILIFPPGTITGDSTRTLRAGAGESYDLVDMAEGDPPKVVSYFAVRLRRRELVQAVGESGPTLIIDP
jgi:hypothetical protein